MRVGFFVLGLSIGLTFGMSAVAEVRVIDGDTLEMDGTVYRINGIDAPEHGQTCDDWHCGQAATKAMVDLVKGQDVLCDPVSSDQYGRVIATCFVDGTDVGADLVDKGLAWAFVKYSDVYVAEETAARNRGLGIWSGSFTAPWDLRAAHWQRAEVQEPSAPPGCPIKGNISDNGRIYHTPWSPWYDRTRVSSHKGERWFCSESDALAAGWRAPYWN